MAGGDDPPEDCRRCAACCFSESPRHARVTGDDYARMGDDAERLVTWIGNLAFMRLERVEKSTLHRCAALTIDPVAPTALPTLRTFGCSIYETRPQVCRELARASDACRGELATKRDRPKRALALLTPSGITKRVT